MSDPIVILAAARTPIGSFQGALSAPTAAELGAVAIRAALARAAVDPGQVDEVLMGSVLQAGQGQAPARQAALLAGLPDSVPCTTINKVCGSAMKAAMLGHDALIAGSARIVVSGGMESMSHAPYLLARARSGYRLGHGQLLDHLFLDGLEDAYREETRGQLMGTFAEACALAYGFTRAEQDAYAVRSTTLARQASENGAFDWEIAPVVVRSRTGETTVARDEGPFVVNLDRIPDLKPAFASNGSVTAANSSSISDGAAALVMTRASVAGELGLVALARVVAQVSHAGLPAHFPTAPVAAIRRLLQRTGWTAGSVDLFEINEAFAVVTLAAIRDLNLPMDKINVHGGACALGHPIGASGARILVTLISALRQRGLQRGIACVCIGGGEATAMAIERC